MRKHATRTTYFLIVSIISLLWGFWEKIPEIQAQTSLQEPISFSNVYTNTLNNPSSIGFGNIQNNTNARIINTTDGMLMESANNGVASLFLNFQNNASLPTTNVRISLEFKDDALNTNNNSELDIGEPRAAKTTYIELNGMQSDGTPIRFYVGINYDGGILDSNAQRNSICIGNSIGDINTFNKKRECLLLPGLNRIPRLNNWISIELYITEIGTYAVVDGIPSFIFGREANTVSNNMQKVGLLTPLTSLTPLNSVIITNKALFENASSCPSGQYCGTGRWRNLKIDSINLNGTINNWLQATTERYISRNPTPVYQLIFPAQARTLRYRFIAEDLAVHAFRYISTQNSQEKTYIESTLSSITVSDFINAFDEDIATNDPHLFLRSGQSLYSFGLTYHMIKDTSINQASKNKLLDFARQGIIKLRDEAIHPSGYPCFVQQNPLTDFDTKSEECMWKAKGLSIALLLPNFTLQEKIQIENVAWETLNETFSKEDDPNRPQSPGWNVFSDGKIANHDYKNNPIYSFCSTLGNLLDVNVSIKESQRLGYQTNSQHTFMRPYSTSWLWNADKYEIGLNNRDNVKYMNPRDYFLFPYTRFDNEPFSQKLPQVEPGASNLIRWERGIDDWGTSGRNCSSGFLLTQTNFGSLEDFDQVVKLTAYTEHHTLAYPSQCVYDPTTPPDLYNKSLPNYRCVYLQRVFEENRQRGLDLQRAHRDMVSFLFLNSIPLTPSPSPSPTIMPSATPFLPEDINQDGIINTNDLMIILSNYKNLILPSNARADINQDTAINHLDSAYILRYLASIGDL